MLFRTQHATAREVGKPVPTKPSPNILFISVDDLNYWVEHLGRNSQTKTPNIDRLAKRGNVHARLLCRARMQSIARCIAGRETPKLDRRLRQWQSVCQRHFSGGVHGDPAQESWLRNYRDGKTVAWRSWFPGTIGREETRRD